VIPGGLFASAFSEALAKVHAHDPSDSGYKINYAVPPEAGLSFFVLIQESCFAACSFLQTKNAPCGA